MINFNRSTDRRARVKTWLKETWRTQDIHHWRHWDFWPANILWVASVLAAQQEVFWVWNHLSDCLKVRSVLGLMSIGAATLIALFAATGWATHVQIKYRHELKPKDPAMLTRED